MIPFGEYLPDQPPLNNPGSSNIANVVPAPNSYRPVQALQVASAGGALSSRPWGAIAVKDSSLNVRVFAGTTTKLYRQNTSLTFDDVSRTSGGAYAVPSGGAWEFAAFGDNLIATNGSDVVQTIDLTSGSNFDALTGSPPKGKRVGIVRDFVVMGSLPSAPNKIQWSGFNNSTQWTVGSNQSDEQEFPTGGEVMAIRGGEVGYIFQESSIRRMTYVGSPLVFQFDEVEPERGAISGGSVVQLRQRIYYWSVDGIYAFDGQRSVPIGTEKVNRTVLDILDGGNAERITGAADPLNNLIFWGFPSPGAQGTPDYILVYHTELDRFTLISDDDTEHQLLFSALQQGSDLDSITTSIDALPASLDSRFWQGGGLLLGAFNTASNLAYFTGPNIEARLETKEAQIFDGQRAVATGIRPQVDATDAVACAAARERLGDMPAYGTESAQQATGECPVFSSGRYHRAKVRIPAGTTWTHAQGVDFDAHPDGVI